MCFCIGLFARDVVCLSRNKRELTFGWGPSEGFTAPPFGKLWYKCVICAKLSICDTSNKPPHFPGTEDSAAVCGVARQPLRSLRRTAAVCQRWLLCACVCQNIQWPSHVQENYQVVWDFSFWQQRWWGSWVFGDVVPCRSVFESDRYMKVNEDWTGLINLAHGGNTILTNLRERLLGNMVSHYHNHNNYHHIFSIPGIR